MQRMTRQPAQLQRRLGMTVGTHEHIQPAVAQLVRQDPETPGGTVAGLGLPTCLRQWMGRGFPQYCSLICLVHRVPPALGCPVIGLLTATSGWLAFSKGGGRVSR